MDAGMMKWALNELEKRYPSPDDITRQAVTAMLNVWGRMTLFAGTEHAKLNREEALDVFTKLARGQALEPVAEADTGVVRKWAPASQYAGMSNIARVRPDFDPSPEGWKLNGRVGSIADVRRGDLIMDFWEKLDGAPNGFRSRLKDFEVDLSHLERQP